MPRNRQRTKKKKSKSAKPKSANQQQQTVQARPPYKPGASTRRKIMPPGIAPNNKAALRNSKALHEMVCSVTDPFCYKARLAKWPDGQGGGTLAMQLRGRNSVVTIAGGAAGNLTQYTGMLPYSYNSGTSFASNTYTMPATWQAINASDFTSYAGTYRIVSWGLIIRNVRSATASEGTVIIRKTSNAIALSGTQTVASMYGAEVTEVPIYPGMETSVIAKPMGTKARDFVSQNTSSTAAYGSGWDCIQIEVMNNNNTAGTVVLDIEYVYNVEITLVHTAATMQEFIPPSAPSIPTVTTAASAVINKATTIVEGGVKTIGTHVLEKVEDFFATAGTDLLGMLF